jgi:voltage-gated sodium channel
MNKLFLNEKFILLLILLNSAVLFIWGYVSDEQELFWLALADNLITLLFIVELAVKFREYGIRRYFESGWNKMDFILILVSVPALVAFLVQDDSQGLGFLLVFRILRIFKSFRFIKFIPDVGRLMEGVQRALKASVFVFLGFILYIFMVGLFSFYLFHQSGADYYTNPMISLYSTFKIFTIEGWFEIPEQVSAGYNATQSFFTYLYFIFVVLTGGIFGLSLVNSIFVDSMVSDNNDELERKIDNLDQKVSELIRKMDKE